MFRREEMSATSCKSILVVEDDEGIREAIQVALELEGYRVQVAADGKEGLEALQHMPTPGLILLDLMTPVMNGWRFAEALRANMTLAQIPIAIVTHPATKPNPSAPR